MDLLIAATARTAIRRRLPAITVISSMSQGSSFPVEAGNVAPVGAGNTDREMGGCSRQRPVDKDSLAVNRVS
jgi:hypothetical protein